MPKRPTPGGGRRRISQIGTVSWTAIEIAGGWAETSDRLSREEREELIRLRTKGRDRRTRLTKGERAKYTSLVVKALGAERLRGLISRPPPPLPDPPQQVSDVDAADRLRQAAELRDTGVITEEDFQVLKTRYLKQL